MSFELRKLTGPEQATAIATPVTELYEDFAQEFDRVVQVQHGTSSLASASGEFRQDVQRNPNNLSRISGVGDSLHASRKIEVSRGTAVGQSHFGTEFYASFLVLEAAGFTLPESDIWVPGIRLKYDALIPRPLQLLRDFGLDDSIRIQPFDELGSNRRTVFEIDPVTEANEDGYEASIVKPATVVVTRALAKLPDAHA